MVLSICDIHRLAIWGQQRQSTSWPRQSTSWQRQQLNFYYNIFHPGNGNKNHHLEFSSPEASYSVEVGRALSSLVDPGKKPSCFT
jgi:hypothetical protein